MIDPVADDVMTQIETLQNEIKERSERISELRRLRSHPVVVPVLHYWRYFTKFAEPYGDYAGYGEWDVLQRAFRHLWWMQEHDHGAPDGVSVGGHYFPMDELEKMYGSPDRE